MSHPKRRLIVRHLPGMVVFLIRAQLSPHLMNISKTVDSAYVICIFICI